MRLLPIFLGMRSSFHPSRRTVCSTSTRTTNIPDGPCSRPPLWRGPRMEVSPTQSTRRNAVRHQAGSRVAETILSQLPYRHGPGPLPIHPDWESESHLLRVPSSNTCMQHYSPKEWLLKLSDRPDP